MRIYVSEGRLLKSYLLGFFRMELGCDLLALSDRIDAGKDVRFGLSGTFSCLGKSNGGVSAQPHMPPIVGDDCSKHPGTSACLGDVQVEARDTTNSMVARLT